MVLQVQDSGSCYDREFSIIDYAQICSLSVRPITALWDRNPEKKCFTRVRPISSHSKTGPVSIFGCLCRMSVGVKATRWQTLSERKLPPPSGSVTLEGVPNFRDLGGYRTINGRVVRRGIVFRSGLLAGATDTDLATLEALAIRTVVDLRTQPEVDVFGADRLPSKARSVSLACPSAGIDPIVETALRAGRFPYMPDLAAANRNHIRDDAELFGELLGILAESANLPSIIHCFGGKDRTGVASAVLLAVLGVPWRTVREDYLRSNEYYQGADGTLPGSLSHTMETRLGHPLDYGDEEAKRRFFVLRRSYIDVVRDEMTRNSRTISEFIDSELRLSSTIVLRLRAELLE